MSLSPSAQFRKKLAVLVTLPTLFFAMQVKLASAVNTGLSTTAKSAGLDKNDTIETIVGTGISKILGLVGVLFLVLMIISGIMWMTAGGKEEQVTKAKKMMVGAIIGVIIIFSSFIITRTVFEALG